MFLASMRNERGEKTKMSKKATETDVTRICPSCGRVLKEEYIACPYCGKDLTGKAEADKQKTEVEKSALYGVIGGLICLVVAWFIFGFIFSLIAIGLGWSGVKKGSSGTKVLGGICIVVGIIFFFISIISMFEI